MGLKTIAFKYQLKDIDSIAEQLLGQFHHKTILLKGDMGSGKTTLVSALLKAMNSSDVVTSPTFSIVNEYDIPKDKVYHFDFYRIESIDEAYNFGIEDYLNSNHWMFMEWPEKIAPLLPIDYQVITIRTLDDDIRSLKLTIETKHLTKISAMTEPKF